MKVLALTRYSQSGASSRVRLFQFTPFLEQQGVRLTAAPLFGDGYIETYNRTSGRSLRQVAQSYARRLSGLLLSGRYDVVWLEKELLPLAPALFERALLHRVGPVVVDYDDATFQWYRGHRNVLVRKGLGRKIERVMAASAVVIAGNRYLSQQATSAGATDVRLIPSVVDVERYKPRQTWAGPVEPLVVGWIGSPSTATYLRGAVPALATLQQERRAEVRLVGAGETDLGPVTHTTTPWSYAMEASQAASFDIGIMPLRDDPWTRGKCGYKLVQYMAAGVPVVADAVSANNDIVVHGETGFLVRGETEWLDALRRLAADPDLRRRMGAAGRQRAEQFYSVASAAPLLHAALRSATQVR